MNFSISIISLLISTVLHAQKAEMKNTLEKFNQTQETLKSSTCLNCLGTETPTTPLICENLYDASCLDKDKNQLYNTRVNDLEITANLNQIKDLVAKDLGYPNYGELFRAKVLATGITFKKNIDDKEWKKFTHTDPNMDYDYSDEKIYDTVDKCQKEKSSVLTYLENNNVPITQITLDKINAFKIKYRDLSFPLMALDLPNFLEIEIYAKCELLKSYQAKDNSKIVKACDKKNLLELKKEAVELYRKEDTPEYQQYALAFVKKYHLPELQTQLPLSDTKENKLRKKIQIALTSLSCDTYQNLVLQTVSTTRTKLAQEIQTSKKMVESLIDFFYSEQRYKQLKDIFNSSKNNLAQIVAKFSIPQSQKEKIIKSYDQLDFTWVTKPPLDYYKLNSNNLLVLNEEKLDYQFFIKNADREINNLYSYLQDKDLNYFKNLNASYLFSKSIGNLQYNETFKILPATLNLLKDNPFGLMQVIAHELGHKIDPDSSKINDHDISAVYQNLLACYKKGTSIKMQSHQQGETIADFLSSEVLAMQIEKLPPSERRPALAKTMQLFCIFENKYYKNESNFKIDPHPEIMLRINGIIAANPHLRKLINCEKSSSNYINCGLEGSDQ